MTTARKQTRSTRDGLPHGGTHTYLIMGDIPRVAFGRQRRIVSGRPRPAGTAAEQVRAELQVIARSSSWSANASKGSAGTSSDDTPDAGFALNVRSLHMIPSAGLPGQPGLFALICCNMGACRSTRNCPMSARV